MGGDERACRGQSVRSSEEAGNDRGAKGRRNVVVAAGLDPTHKGRRSAARLCASVRRRVAWGQTAGDQWAAWEQVSGAGGLARLVRCLRTPCDECLSQPIRTTNWKAGCGRHACPVWVGGGGVTPASYPHPSPLYRFGLNAKTASFKLNRPPRCFISKSPSGMPVLFRVPVGVRATIVSASFMRFSDPAPFAHYV